MVDPADAAPVPAALNAHRLSLAAILVTRHHDDHVGAADALCNRLDRPVYGPVHETIPAPHVALNGGDALDVLGLPFGVIDVPGHTRGHIAYFHNGADQAPLLFCGDPLFPGGAARPTLPATIARERLINPFLRCAEPAVAQAAQRHGATSRVPVDVFAALRQ